MSLPNAILGLLMYTPMTGYDLKTMIDRSINFIWTAHLSQIYRELGVLEEKGLLTSRIEPQEDRPDKKIYSVTEEGEKAFLQWLGKFPAILSTSTRDEFALRIFFGSKLSDEELAFQLERFIREKKEELALLDTVAEIILTQTEKSGMESERFYWNLLLKRGVAMGQVLVKWAEESAAELREHHKGRKKE